jgi:hypothetical protein
MVQLKKEANLARAEWTEACKHKLERCIEQREEDQQDYRHLFPSSRSQIAAHVEHTRCPHANARANEASRMPQSVYTYTSPNEFIGRNNGFHENIDVTNSMKTKRNSEHEYINPACKQSVTQNMDQTKHENKAKLRT